MHKPLTSWSAILLSTILFFSVNIIAYSLFRNTNIDLTEDKIFTVSEGTKSIIGKLEDPTRLEFFFSENLLGQAPQLLKYGNRIKDLLLTYEALSEGMIELTIIDPEPFSQDEDRALAYGIQALTLNQLGEKAYFGLAGSNLTGGRDKIPFFQLNKKNFLEYDLTRFIQKLTVSDKPVIGIMSDLALNGIELPPQMQKQNIPPWEIMNQLSAAFEMRSVSTDTSEIDGSIRVLVLIHPTMLSEKTLYAIDQFVMNGGRLIAFVDPYSEYLEGYGQIIAMQTGKQLSTSSDISRLFDAYGIITAKDVFVGDLDRAYPLAVNTKDPNKAGYSVEYLPWQNIRMPQISKDNVAVATLDNLNIGSAGFVDVSETSSLTLSRLFWTTPNTKLLATSQLQGLDDHTLLLKDFQASNTEYVIAASLSGPLTSAFDGPPPVLSETGKGGDTASPQIRPHKAQSTEPANIVVVADSDILYDSFWAQKQNILGSTIVIPFANNFDFLINTIEYMVGSNELIGLRGRGVTKRTFTKIEKMRSDAALQFQAQENAMEQKLQQLQAQFDALLREKNDTTKIITEQQLEMQNKARDELISTRMALRKVQLNFNRDINTLKSWIKLINIAAIPLLLLLGTCGIFVLARYRDRSRKKSLVA